jgi:hypothetical protein
MLFLPSVHRSTRKLRDADGLYERIVRQMAAHKATIEGVSMVQYNEPTADSLFSGTAEFVETVWPCARRTQ